jgi:hypothetical protein
MPQKIRWVLAHEPIELFLRAAKKFKATMVRTLSILLSLFFFAPQPSPRFVRWRAR